MNLFLREVSNIDESGRALLGHLAAKGVHLSAAGFYNSWLRKFRGRLSATASCRRWKEANGLIGGPTGAAARLGLPDDLAIPHAEIQDRLPLSLVPLGGDEAHKSVKFLFSLAPLRGEGVRG